jgi:hypothetical protein
MASKKKAAKAAKTKRAKKTASGKAPKIAKKGGPHRACGVCGTLGHNRRSHSRNGKLKKKDT